MSYFTKTMGGIGLLLACGISAFIVYETLTGTYIPGSEVVGTIFLFLAFGFFAVGVDVMVEATREFLAYHKAQSVLREIKRLIKNNDLHIEARSRDDAEIIVSFLSDLIPDLGEVKVIMNNFAFEPELRDKNRMVLLTLRNLKGFKRLGCGV